MELFLCNKFGRGGINIGFVSSLLVLISLLVAAQTTLLHLLAWHDDRPLSVFLYCFQQRSGPERASLQNGEGAVTAFSQRGYCEELC